MTESTIDSKICWYHNDLPIEVYTDLPEQATHIIYLIHNLDTQKSYIGKKALWSHRSIKLGKRELAALQDKRASKRKYVKKPSDWCSYTGSNDELNQDIKEGHMIIKEILHVCYSNKEATYRELQAHIDYKVIEPGHSHLFYNGNVLGKFFPRDLIHNFINE